MVQKIGMTLSAMWIGTAVWIITLGACQGVHQLNLEWWAAVPLTVTLGLAGFAVPVIILRYIVDLWFDI